MGCGRDLNQERGLVVDIGDRVYYRENGPDDSGTVIDITDDGIVVAWDADPDGAPSDSYSLRELRVTKV